MDNFFFILIDKLIPSQRFTNKPPLQITVQEMFVSVCKKIKIEIFDLQYEHANNCPMEQ